MTKSNSIIVGGIVSNVVQCSMYIITNIHIKYSFSECHFPWSYVKLYKGFVNNLKLVLFVRFVGEILRGKLLHYRLQLYWYNITY